LKQTSDYLDELKTKSNSMGEKNDAKLDKKWKKKVALDKQKEELINELSKQNAIKSEIALQVFKDEKTLTETLDEKRKLMMKKQGMNDDL
jgi:hypothetical protein